MGDDMNDWCDTRLRAALKPPPHLSDAAQYYYNQVAGRVKDERALEELDRWRKSIAHKTRIVRLIDLGTGTSRLWTELESHPATSGMSKYAADDPHSLGRRLASDAESEFGLFLASLYRLRFYKLLTYGFLPLRPS
jgi:ferric-dicitrate binding protein FerR (iron transport regulator)